VGNRRKTRSASVPIGRRVVEIGSGHQIILPSAASALTAPTCKSRKLFGMSHFHKLTEILQAMHETAGSKAAPILKPPAFWEAVSAGALGAGKGEARCIGRVDLQGDTQRPPRGPSTACAWGHVWPRTVRQRPPADLVAGGADRLGKERQKWNHCFANVGASHKRCVRGKAPIGFTAGRTALRRHWPRARNPMRHRWWRAINKQSIRTD
jgi:hypothetical protein